MFYWALILLVVGLIASLFGFGGLSSAAIGLAKGLVLLKVVGIILVLGAIGLGVAGFRGGGGLRH